MYFYIIPKKGNISKLSTKKGAIDIRWTPQSKVSGYEIQYKYGAGSWKSIWVKSGSIKTVKNLIKNKKYSVRIQAYISDKGNNYYGGWSSTKTIKCK